MLPTPFLDIETNELDLLQMDFLAADTLDGPYEVIVMGEVLEHVETARRVSAARR
jgi:2-polyprenyl-3-methyl-5-hydroxy-6-metoxy-1,4-benzoquinol methylase